MEHESICLFDEGVYRISRLSDYLLYKYKGTVVVHTEAVVVQLLMCVGIELIVAELFLIPVWCWNWIRVLYNILVSLSCINKDSAYLVTLNEFMELVHFKSPDVANREHEDTIDFTRCVFPNEIVTQKQIVFTTLWSTT